MPWKEIGPMQERVRFVVAYQSGLYGMSELCEAYGVSRKSGYKWLARWEAEGVAGLVERSRAPHSSPHTLDPVIREAIVRARKDHPSWGPVKLLPYLRRHSPQLADRLPAPSTAGELLKRCGLVEPRKRRARSSHPGAGSLQADAPNDVWCADFKGEFRTQDGQLCYPLTVSDANSRFLLACHGLTSTGSQDAQGVFERLFREAGLPTAIRSDNGCPFCSHALSGLSRLSVWWLKLGIDHQRIQPGKPQQNGRHERMHRTLKAETLRPPEADRQKQQERFDSFRREYNGLRPHQALDNETPSSLWTPSQRQMPPILPQPQYAGHLQVRSVRSNGFIRFKGKAWFVSELLVKERVGLEETDDGIWSLFFYNKLLAKLDEAGDKLVPVEHGRPKGAKQTQEGKTA